MNISKPFILRPVATCLLMVAIFLVGWISYRGLPISALPSVDYPTIQVVTTYPGASPELTASTISSPLEKQLGQVTGVTKMLSQSSNGVSVITLQFDLSQKISVVEQDIQAAINTASSLLPNNLPSPPIYHKVNPADPPILTLAVTSNDLPMTKVQDLVDTRLAQKLSQVKGVGLISFAGGQRPAIRINYNPQMLSALGLDAETIRTNINTSNVNQAKGGFNGKTRSATITANDQLQSVSDYENLIIAYKNNTAIRLKDIATIEESAENSYQIAEVKNTPAILVQVQKQPGANVIATVDAIKRILPQLEETLPAQVKVEILSDRTDSIRASIADVKVELLLAITLVILVIYLFLRKIPATIIPSIVVPLSLIGTFAVLYSLDFSINNLTLMALTIATGFVVDDAIVVIENITRYIEKGMAPLDAALKGAGEIGFTIISLTISLVAVLIPLLFMPDLIGKLFREFAVTLAVSILISAVISLTLTPMMCAYMLRPEHESNTPRWLMAIEKFIDKTIEYYGYLLKIVLNHKLTTLMVTIATFLLTVALFIGIPKGFFPVQDNSQIIATIDVAQSSSFANLVEKQRQATEIVLKNDNVISVTTTSGVDSNNLSPATGSMQIQLKPLDERDQHITEIIKDLQNNLSNVAGITAYLQPVQDLTVDTIVSRAKYQLSVQASSMKELSSYTPKILDKLEQQPALKDLNTDLQDKGLETHITIDRDSAARLGVTASEIDTALYNAFGQRQISTIFTQNNQYQVVLGLDPKLAEDPSILNELHVLAENGKVLPLLSIAKIEMRTSPLTLNRLDQFPYANISFDLVDDYSLGDAIKQVNKAIEELDLPFSVNVQYQGSTQIFKASLANEVWLIIAAIVVMYIVLGILYESYIHPITILSTLPTAGVGALLSLIIAGRNLNIIGIIGLILLIGIVKKNAIMMIDFALSAEREDGLSPKEAIFQACLLRFRPILMTTLAAAFGALPLMLGTGVGAEMRQPLGITIIGGLLFSQVLTLFTTPVIYLTFDSLARRWLKTSSKLVNSGSSNEISQL